MLLSCPGPIDPAAAHHRRGPEPRIPYPIPDEFTSSADMETEREEEMFRGADLGINKVLWQPLAAGFEHGRGISWRGGSTMDKGR